MVKIGILTINDYKNYGNRLQNYATQEFLKTLGYDSETIINKTMNLKGANKRIQFNEKFTRLLGSSPDEAINKFKTKIYRHKYKNEIRIAEQQKKDSFIMFSKKYINETDFYISDKEKNGYLENNYDFFITGSDQVWNPLFARFSNIDLLEFAPKHKRIAFAPSFGISELPKEYLKPFGELLSEMKYLSVREHAGAKIIKELTNRNAKVLLDPTLMLTKEKWLSISVPSKNKPKNNYLLTYFLGNISYDTKKIIKKTAKEKNLEVVNLANISDLKRYSADPSEFIDYINSSSVLFTDSFHGAVFSILLEKPFVVFERAENLPSMNSRIDTLLSTFELNSRKSELINDKEIFEVDYSHIDRILAYHRNQSKIYLTKAFDQ